MYNYVVVLLLSGDQLEHNWGCVEVAAMVYMKVKFSNGISVFVGLKYDKKL